MYLYQKITERYPDKMNPLGMINKDKKTGIHVFDIFRTMLILMFVYATISQGSIYGQKAEIIEVQASPGIFNIWFESSASMACRIELYHSVIKGESWHGPLQGLKLLSGSRVVTGKANHIEWPVGRDSFLSERVDIQFHIKLIPLDNFEPELEYVEGGSFLMGCTNAHKLVCDINELPIQRVSVGSFYMGKYEITRFQWFAIMGEVQAEDIACADCPIEMVSHEEIQVYLGRLHGRTGKQYRLPTEAEWEYAARGGNHGEDFLYSGGDSLDVFGWYEGNATHRHVGNDLNRVQPVGLKQPNVLGLYDLSGNVWEWCSDMVGQYKKGLQINPQGYDAGGAYVTRGGGWADLAENCRVSYRGGNDQSNQDDDIGFRVILMNEKEINIDNISQ